MLRCDHPTKEPRHEKTWSAPLLFAHGKNRFSHDVAWDSSVFEIKEETLKETSSIKLGTH